VLGLPTAIDGSGGAWNAVRSPHFTVVTDGAVEGADRLARRFERLRVVFSRLWPTARSDAKSVVVVAPAGDASLAALLPPTWQREGVMHPAGLMVSGLDRVYLTVPLGRDEDDVEHVAVHEYVHLLVEANIPAVPLWLNEGLAEFFAAGRLDQRPAAFGLPHAGHLHVLRTREWLPLEALLSATRGAATVSNETTSATFYAQSWALVHFLKLGEGGRHAATLTAFTAAIAHGVPPQLAGEQAFGDLAVLGRRLRAYVRGERFFDARLPMPTPDDSVPPIERGAPWEAALLLGDFQTHVGHYAEGERWLARAAAMTPANAAVFERRALLAFQQQDVPRALANAQQALQIEPGRPLAHYLKAVALLAAGTGMTGDSTRDAEASLRKAIAASPTLAPAYTTLGGLLAARSGPTPEALALIQRAIALDPSGIGHHVTLGQVLLVSGDAAEARRVAEHARATARTATERETVERLLAAALHPDP
jgi:tetratricopeptide (TPR) repeat protein